jgi:hypothetical protein
MEKVDGRKFIFMEFSMQCLDLTSKLSHATKNEAI